MKFNLTTNIIYRIDSSKIPTAEIKGYLCETKQLILDFYEISENDIPLKFTNPEFKLSEKRVAWIVIHVMNYLLNSKVNIEKLVKDAFTLNQKGNAEGQTALINKIYRQYNFTFGIFKEYEDIIISALSLLLVVLHFNKIIFLPHNFNFPYTYIKNMEGANKTKTKIDLAIKYYPEMFKLLRLSAGKVDTKTNFVAWGTKIILCLGWVDFEDSSTEELLEFKKQYEYLDLHMLQKDPPIYKLASFLQDKFLNKVNINMSLLTLPIPKISSRNNITANYAERVKKINFNDLSKLNMNQNTIKSWGNFNAAFFAPKLIEGLSLILPDYKKSIENWSMLQASYIKKRKLESYKTINLSLSYFNGYLFYLLPMWYKNNSSNISYPSKPQNFKGGIFISRLIETKECSPPTLLEFLEKIQLDKELKNEYIYVILKNIEGFFDFIQTYSDELPGCQGFTQPISTFDYPKVTKSKGTNKGLIPRHLFAHLLNYMETISIYNKIVLEKVLNNGLSMQTFKNNPKYNNELIDTTKVQNEVGYIPVIFIGNQMIVLKQIPNILDSKITNLKSGKCLDLPYPHVLNHLLVALQTGLRSNHIQWLDAEKFASGVKEDDYNTFVPLYVNTDKSKTQAWSPMVSRKVIDILKSQLEWRNLIENPAFNEKKFYNNNHNTKWESFYPLFSYGAEGLPYSDKYYYEEWQNILKYFQGVIAQTTLKKVELGKMLPKGVLFSDFNRDEKAKQYGKNCDKVCEIRYSTDITPHSARVSVVSHYITVLPADVIGQYITGQTEAVVHHYVKLDPQYLTEIESNQRDGLQRLAIQNQFDNLTGREKSHPILADKENSNLAQSMKINKEETIARYGCVSLSIKEEGITGIDLLRNESNTQLAFNKTEICPYNNQCPNDLIKELKGFRRCGMCPYAIRSIDHLPAIAVKKRQMLEFMEEIDNKLDTALADQLNTTYSIEDIDRLEDEKQRIGEELLGWIISEEMLEANRKSLMNSSESIKFVVQKPEILIADLQQISHKENDVQYLLTRLVDCESFPTLDTPLVRAKFDLLRRQLLAKLGDFKQAFDSKLPANPAYECLGLIKGVVERHGLSHEQVIGLLSTDMINLPNINKPLLLTEGKYDKRK